MSRSKKRILMVVFTIFVIIIVLFVRDSGRQNHELLAFDFDMFNYAWLLEFDWQMRLNGKTYNNVWDISRRVDRSSIIGSQAPCTDYYDLVIVLVHYESEATDFPENVIAAWPRAKIVDYDLTFAERTVQGFNWAVNRCVNELGHGIWSRSIVSFDEFGLTYPLQVSDFVDNWEKVYTLWRSFLTSERNSIPQGEFEGSPIQRNKRIFASPLGFGFNFLVVVDGEKHVGSYVTDSNMVTPWHPDFNRFYDTLVFVRNECEAHGFPDNVVVAWPAEDCMELRRRLEILNWEVTRDSSSLTFGGNRPPIRSVIGIEGLETDYGLTYPISAEDLVYNWQAVMRLMLDIGLNW